MLAQSWNKSSYQFGDIRPNFNLNNSNLKKNAQIKTYYKNRPWYGLLHLFKPPKVTHIFFHISSGNFHVKNNLKVELAWEKNMVMNISALPECWSLTENRENNGLEIVSNITKHTVSHSCILSLIYLKLAIITLK